MTHTMPHITAFAIKWLNLFLDEKTELKTLVGAPLPAACRAMGFIMDMGHSFADKYKPTGWSIDDLYNVLNEVTDISVLGNGLYSLWRYYNHWAYSGKEILVPSNRGWFILALLRMGELSIRHPNQPLAKPLIGEKISQEQLTAELELLENIPSSAGEEIAARLINTAAEKGITEALYLLGEIFEYGNGFEKNHHFSFSFYYQAAQRQHEDACLKVAECFRTGRGTEADENKAVHWYEQAAMAGKAEAQFWYGIAHEEGIAVPAALGEALKWYLLAAEQNHAGAQYNAAICYHYGRGTEADVEKALHYYQLSAEAGHSAAQYNLGVCCAEGIGRPADIREAVYWYTKAAESGYTKAQVNLASCYQHGDGVPTDAEMAKLWYTQAAKQGDPYAMEALKQLTEK